MTIRFFINSEKKDLAHIYVGLSLGRKQRLICKTGLLVETQRWSNDTETIRQRKLSDNDRKLISRLSSLRTYLDSEVRISAIGPKSKDWLQSLINKFHNVTSEDHNGLNGYIQIFIDKIDSGEVKNTGALNYAKGVVRAFKGFQGVFNRYQGMYSEKEIKRYQENKKKLRDVCAVDFDDINLEFYRSFVKYLSDEGYGVNTIGRFIKHLKHIMHRALIEKKHSNREFEEFIVVTEDSHAIYLTTDEIEKLYIYKCEDPRQELARDCFIVLCETALRISDYKKINIGIRGRFIDIFQTKTSGKVVIPLTARMEQILEKYKGKLPYIHENYVNEYIKTIAFRCGLTDRVTWVTQEKGLKHETSAQKWSLVTCHTGRRSAATNMYLAGIKPIDIMKITGHKTEKSFLKYIRITEEETARNLAKHPYFNNLRVAN
jgi:integrase